MASLDSVATRCNRKIITSLPPGGAGGFMSCYAQVYDATSVVRPAARGQYKAATSTHAEMNALANYLRRHGTLAGITRIVISSPPCKSCAFVMELLGVIGKVVTTGKIYKHATSAWAWPARLRNPTSFQRARWMEIKRDFLGTGLTEKQIVGHVAHVVSTRSSL